MTYAVWHRDEPDFEGKLENAASFPLGYTLVAVVRTDESIDKAYELTNSINRHWSENDVTVYKFKARSTSVGDVILIQDTQRAMLCSNIGWTDLG